MKRYQLYNRLAEVSFWITAVWLIVKILCFFAPAARELATMRLIGSIYRILFPANVLLAIFLIVARFMRDEFAERIWQQTARLFVYVVILGSFASTLGFALGWRQISAHFQDIFSAEFVGLLKRAPSPEAVYVSGIATTLMVVTLITPQLFIFFYRWGLWRDSR